MNLAAPLESVLGNILPQTVTNLFLLVLITVLIIAMVASRLGRMGKLVQYTPNLLTSLGILGTFVGIVIGLLNFDTANIDGSIGPLLAGLKTAFITSLAGMAAAILFKILDGTGLISPPTPKEEPESATPEQVLGSMMRQERAMMNLATAISGDGETTLTSQIRLMRSEQADAQARLREEIQGQKKTFAEFQDRLWLQMETFAEMLSKSATEQVINALKEVIADFNKNLTEQFGDNFKRLDEAVAKLVDWQENYRVQLEQMSEQYSEGVKAIGHTREMVGQIEADTKKIPEAMDSLKSLLETTQHQLAELERHLEAFKDMRDRAVEAVPQIKTQIDSILEDVSTAARESGERISKVTEEMQSSLITGLEEFQNNVSRSNEGLTTASDALATRSGEISEQLAVSVKEINEQVRDLVERMDAGSKSISKTLSETNSTLERQTSEVQEKVANSIQQMNERVEKSMDEVTRHHMEASSRASEKLTKEIQHSVQETVEAISETNTSLKRHTADVQENVAGSIQDMNARIEKTMDELTRHHIDASSRASQSLSKELERSVQETGEAVNAQLKVIDDAQKQEISRVMSEMGKALAQISNQFTSDYRRLTEQMQQVVNRSGRGQ